MVKKGRKKVKNLQAKTAIVCGGSMGIGKETAKEIVRLGGSVCIIARHLLPLEEAKDEIQQMIHEDLQFVEMIISDTTDSQELEIQLVPFIEQHGVPDYLINAVGYAYPQYLEKLTLEDFRNAMKMNYYGQLIPTMILLPYFHKACKGHIAFISSVMGFLGIMGYASYAPTKFALVGLAEVMRHELKPHNIDVSILFPPDTVTPGFEMENRSKPPECAMISRGVKVLSPTKVAEEFIEGLLARKFFILPGGASRTWKLFRFFPWLVRAIIDRQYYAAMKELGKLP